MNAEVEVVLDRFQIRPYQIPVFNAIEKEGARKVILVACRRSGKDFLAWNLAIRQCIKEKCLVQYLLPSYGQARRAIFDCITIQGVSLLDYIPPQLIFSINKQEMKITFVNGSILQCLGGDSFQTAIIGTNPKAVILSEYSRMVDCYPYIRPILAANKGWVLFCSCVSPNTFIITQDGLKRISNISDVRSEYSDLNQNIFGLKGFHNAEQFYYGGKQATLKIILASGYELECTPIHPIWNGSEWIRAKNWNIGDLVPIQYGQNIWGNGIDFSQFKFLKHGNSKELKIDLISEDFYYLLGLIQSDGCFSDSQITVTKKRDKEIISFLRKMGFITEKDNVHHRTCSKEFCALLDFLGFKRGAKNKIFPEKLLDCTKNQMKSFLQGLFDGDGSSNSSKNKRGNICIASVSKEFIKDLQVILLNFGIVSSFQVKRSGITPKVKVESTCYILEISGYFANIFYKEIGFKLERKQKNSIFVPESCFEEHANIYPIDVSKLNGYSLPKWKITNKSRISRRLLKKMNDENPHPYLSFLLGEKFYYSPIKSIEQSESEVFDFVIPDTHSFFSNGFISHNTPFGKNHFFNLVEFAKESPDWKVFIQPVTETKHIDEEELEQERLAMSPELFEQEYMCSFSRGVVGSYYGLEINQAKTEGRISEVAWDPTLPVYTAWDIGVRDETTILFYQTTSTCSVVRIIDSYSNSNVGISHYAKIVSSKPYNYKFHFAPHDILVREWGNDGITRKEKAAQLGINFTLVDNIPLLEGIDHVKANFGKLWFNESTTKTLINALENYYREYDDEHQVYNLKPVHNWASHYADALRYLCVSLTKTKTSYSAEDITKIRNKALYGNKFDNPFGWRQS